MFFFCFWVLRKPLDFVYKNTIELRLYYAKLIAKKFYEIYKMNETTTTTTEMVSFVCLLLRLLLIKTNNKQLSFVSSTKRLSYVFGLGYGAPLCSQYYFDRYGFFWLCFLCVLGVVVMTMMFIDVKKEELVYLNKNNKSQCRQFWNVIPLRACSL